MRRLVTPSGSVGVRGRSGARGRCRIRGVWAPSRALFSHLGRARTAPESKSAGRGGSRADNRGGLLAPSALEASSRCDWTRLSQRALHRKESKRAEWCWSRRQSSGARADEMRPTGGDGPRFRVPARRPDVALAKGSRGSSRSSVRALASGRAPQRARRVGPDGPSQGGWAARGGRRYKAPLFSLPAVPSPLRRGGMATERGALRRRGTRAGPSHPWGLRRAKEPLSGAPRRGSARRAGSPRPSCGGPGRGTRRTTPACPAQGRPWPPS